MKTYRMAGFSLLIGMLTLTGAFAETLVLKSGKTIEGKIIEKTDSCVTIEFEEIPLTFYSDEIERIEEGKVSGVVQPPIADLSVVNQINNAYYVAQLHGVSYLKCEVKNSLFEEIIKKKYPSLRSAAGQEKKILDSIKFYFEFPKDFSFGLEVTSFAASGNAQFDRELTQAIDEVRSATTDFCKWVLLKCLTPILGLAESKYKVVKSQNGYCVSSETEEGSYEVCADLKFLPAYAIKINSHNSPLKQTFDFMSTSQGPLLVKYEHVSQDGEERYSAALEYQEVQRFQMIKHAVIQTAQQGRTQNLELDFSSFEFKK